MAKCAHCDGTGEAPDKITLECVICQRKVVVTYTASDDVVAICENVRCSDCKQEDAARQALSSRGE